MREAFSLERESLRSALEASQCSARVLFIFKGKRDLPVERVTFSSLRKDIATLCRTAISKLEFRSCP